MGKVFINLSWTEGTPTPEQVADKLGLEPEELDHEFGVIEIDPEEHLYTILVEQQAAERLSDDFKAAEGVEGPFANPKIAPFDLQEEE